jgi:hypothetical protein
LFTLIVQIQLLISLYVVETHYYVRLYSVFQLHYCSWLFLYLIHSQSLFWSNQLSHSNCQVPACILVVQSLIFSLKTSYPDRGFSWFPSISVDIFGILPVNRPWLICPFPIHHSQTTYTLMLQPVELNKTSLNQHNDQSDHSFWLFVHF